VGENLRGQPVPVHPLSERRWAEATGSQFLERLVDSPAVV
jgi:hypothetical protein